MDLKRGLLWLTGSRSKYTLILRNKIPHALSVNQGCHCHWWFAIPQRWASEPWGKSGRKQRISDIWRTCRVDQTVKNLPEIWETGFDPWAGKTPREGHGTPLQYSCLEHPMDRGAWRATVHGVAKSWTWPSDGHYNASSCQTAATTDGDPWGHSGFENAWHWPQIAEKDVKGMVSVSPDSCTSPYKEKW